MTRILGIDPGSRITGYGLIDEQNSRLVYHASGCIRIQAETLAQKLAQVYAGIAELVAEHQPDIVAIERVFMAKNADSALKLGQARGSAIVCVANHGLTLHEYSAKEVKQAVTGSGGADKRQVQIMVKQLLKLSGIPQADAADALAIALCHAYASQGLLPLVREARKTSKKSGWRHFTPPNSHSG